MNKGTAQLLAFSVGADRRIQRQPS